MGAAGGLRTTMSKLEDIRHLLPRVRHRCHAALPHRAAPAAQPDVAARPAAWEVARRASPTLAHMTRTLLDVTDLVEFLQRQESVSGVQRVIAETAPLILAADPTAAVVVLDRPRGVFVPLTPVETDVLVRRGVMAGQAVDRDQLAAAASGALARARTAAPVVVDPACVVVFLGAVWINDALMLAARDAHAAGARCVYLLYDLTPVLETGHTAAVNKLFDRYLALVAQTASRVPAISRSSRTDFEAYCRDHEWAAPPGGVTGLPCGITPGQFDTARVAVAEALRAARRHGGVAQEPPARASRLGATHRRRADPMRCRTSSASGGWAGTPTRSSTSTCARADSTAR